MADVALDALSAADATALLRPVCASTRWLSSMVDGRPYGSFDALATAADDALDSLDWPEVLEALAAHPRVGERPADDSQEAAWSREEQSAAAVGAAEIEASLTAANVAYEQRFGHVFLVCATGLSSQQVLDNVNTRLGNDEATEQRVVRGELAAIVALRLGKLSV